MRVVCIIQARLTSTRFPRKVLEKINGKSMIAWVCEAARSSHFVHKVVVAWAHKFPHLDENDVLGRYREIAQRENADVIVRITSDCPLLTGQIIDDTLIRFAKLDDPYYCNRYLAEDGFDVQVFKRELLNSHTYTHKEHVIYPFLQGEKYSVDTLEDLLKIKDIICATK